MKKLITSVILLGILVGGYVWLSRYRVTFTGLEGTTVTAHRGDLVVPITASGNVKAASITQVKSKASGEVVKIPFRPGQIVRKGELLVELLDVDERRSVERSQADYNRAEIAVQQAQITLRQREVAGLGLARAKVEQANGRALGAKARYEFYRPATRPASEGGVTMDMSPGEWDQIESAFLEANAGVLAAQAEMEQARIAVEMSRQDVKTAQENLNAAKAALNDAEERLRETKIFSPIDGMILVCNIQIGEVVQSGKTMFTGGTVLLEVADLSEIYAVVNVDEADMGQVRELAPASARPGVSDTQPATLPAGTLEERQPVEVTVEALRDMKFEGEIDRISPQAENVQAIATFKVWVRVTSDNRNELAGLLNTQCEAHFTAKSVQNAILISYDAIQKNPLGDDYGVYVPDNGPDRYKFKPCRFGTDNGIEVEVIRGLDEGEVVYTKLPQMTRKQQEEKEKKS